MNIYNGKYKELSESISNIDTSIGKTTKSIGYFNEKAMGSTEDVITTVEEAKNYLISQGYTESEIPKSAVEIMDLADTLTNQLTEFDNNVGTAYNDRYLNKKLVGANEEIESNVLADTLRVLSGDTTGKGTGKFGKNAYGNYTLTASSEESILNNLNEMFTKEIVDAAGVEGILYAALDDYGAQEGSLRNIETNIIQALADKYRFDSGLDNDTAMEKARSIYKAAGFKITGDELLSGDISGGVLDIGNGYGSDFSFSDSNLVAAKQIMQLHAEYKDIFSNYDDSGDPGSRTIRLQDEDTVRRLTGLDFPKVRAIMKSISTDSTTGQLDFGKIYYYATGNPFITSSRLAMLHQGEAVLTAKENRDYMAAGVVSSLFGTGASAADILNVRNSIRKQNEDNDNKDYTEITSAISACAKLIVEAISNIDSGIVQGDSMESLQKRYQRYGGNSNSGSIELNNAIELRPYLTGVQ